MNRIIAIDPGNVETAVVLMSKETYEPLGFFKAKNDFTLKFLKEQPPMEVVIEMVASYGKAVGKEVFDTCIWIGRFTQQAEQYGHNVSYIIRPNVKLNICLSRTAKDPNVMRALIDRFARHDLRSGKGTKGQPDFFYGFAKDIWAAFALGTTFIDLQKEEQQRQNKTPRK